MPGLELVDEIKLDEDSEAWLSHSTRCELDIGRCAYIAFCHCGLASS